MPYVLETEVLRHCLLPIEAQATAVTASFELEQLDAIRLGLTELLLAEAASGHVPVVTQELAIQVPRDFKSILYKTKGGNKVVAFSFGDATTETALQILGLAIVLFTTGPTLATVPQVGGY